MTKVSSCRCFLILNKKIVTKQTKICCLKVKQLLLEEHKEEISSNIDIEIVAENYITTLFGHIVVNRVVGVECKYTDEEIGSSMTNILFDGIKNRN